MADFKNLQPALKIYQVHSATFEVVFWKIVMTFKTTLRNKEKIQAQIGITQVDHIKVKLLRQH
jgi:hypothetical protein